MLRPSYSELMEQLNDDMDLDNQITSRYTIVIAAAKRARQIIDGAPHYRQGAATDKAVSIAINEMSKGLIIIQPEGLPKTEGEWQTGYYEDEGGYDEEQDQEQEQSGGEATESVFDAPLEDGFVEV